ncbi:hypothetical protein PsAD14_03684 [Pseudovibrio sp. Ad14]|nr:hypothetical protein PsAD14_03684 [Pseudovibrio sp. Ad14]
MAWIDVIRQIGVTERERASAVCSFRPYAGQADLEESRIGKLLSLSCGRAYIDHIRGRFNISERRICCVLATSTDAAAVATWAHRRRTPDCGYD